MSLRQSNRIASQRKHPVIFSKLNRYPFLQRLTSVLLSPKRTAELNLVFLRKQLSPGLADFSNPANICAVQQFQNLKFAILSCDAAPQMTQVPKDNQTVNATETAQNAFDPEY